MIKDKFNFIKAFKDSKYEKLEKSFRNGENVALYGNDYKIVKNIADQTILQDIKGFKFTIPTQKLEGMLRKSKALLYSGDLLEKAKGRKDPIGTVRGGRKKVAEGKWVHIGTGKTYGSSSGEDHIHFSKLLSKDDKENLKTIVKAARKKLGTEKAAEVAKDLKQFLQYKTQAKQLKQHLEHEATKRPLRHFDSERYNNKVDQANKTLKNVINKIKG